MNKIVGIIHPFDVNQNFYIYDGQNISHTIIKMEDIPETIVNLSHMYNAYQIDLAGAEYFINGIIKQIQEKENNKYSENKLIIKCI